LDRFEVIQEMKASESYVEEFLKDSKDVIRDSIFETKDNTNEALKNNLME